MGAPDAPLASGPDGSVLKIPTSLGPEFPSPHGEEWTGQAPPGTGNWRPPLWVLGAWERPDGDPELETALSAYYEAIRLGRRHPSLSLLTFVAATEMSRRAPSCLRRHGTHTLTIRTD